ncbi:MAG: glutathione S-transferase family protein [Caulobacteraceae bacterium]
MYTLYGFKSSGSVAVEAALILIGAPYIRVDAALWGDAEEQARARAANPLGQIPALLLPSGELMTESAAILIWLADAHPQAGLAPGLQSPRRPAFLRWMAYVAAEIYALYWVRDDLSRLAADDAHQAVIDQRTRDRIAFCWRSMDAQVAPGRFLLGDELSVLDIYVALVSRWKPGRMRFHAEAPRMGEIVRRVDGDPRLAALWRDRAPMPQEAQG